MRPEADTEAKLADAYAQSLDVPFLIGHAQVPVIARDLGIGLEEAGRHARYEFLRQAAFRTESQFIATAHTADDQAETILFHAVRGGGVAGLGGIPRQRDNIVRPLLTFTRAETQGFCDERGLWYHQDPANHDLSFARARLRHEVLPALELVHPGAKSGLLKLGEIAREETDFLDGMAAAALEQCELPLNGELDFLTRDIEVAFQRDRLETLPTILFKRAIRLAVRALGAELTYEQSQAFLNLSESGSFTAPGSEIVVEWNSDQIHARHRTAEEPFRHPLTIPGETVADSLGWQLTAEESIYRGESITRAGRTCLIRAAAIRGPLYFRSVARGDEIQPLGFDGKRKLSDVLSEAKLTAAARTRLPIVCDLVGPLWAPGVCADERTRPIEPAEPVLRLSFGTVQPGPN
jgi:tRNA(Ile)-lysidine synthase